MSQLESDVVDYLKGERVPITRQAFVVGIVTLSTHSNAWQRATHEQWGEALDRCIKSGSVVEEADKVRVAPARPKGVQTQMELF